MEIDIYFIRVRYITPCFFCSKYVTSKIRTRKIYWRWSPVFLYCWDWTEPSRKCRNRQEIDRRSLCKELDCVGDVQSEISSIPVTKILEFQDAGADCVKFQKTSLNDKFTKSALERPYNSEHSWGDTYGEHKAYLEFSREDFALLKMHAEKRNLLFSASAKDIVSLFRVRFIFSEFGFKLLYICRLR